MAFCGPFGMAPMFPALAATALAEVKPAAADGQGLYVLIIMILFIGTLLEGLLYAIRKGVLKWE